MFLKTETNYVFYLDEVTFASGANLSNSAKVFFISKLGSIIRVNTTQISNTIK